MNNASGSAASFLGIDLSGPTMRAALVKADGEVIERRESPIEADKLVTQVADVVRELRTAHPNIAAVGVAIPGLVNRKTDRVIASRDLPSTVREDLHSEFWRRLDCVSKSRTTQSGRLWRVHRRRR